MSGKSIAVFAIVSCLFLSICKINALPAEQSISDSIKNDKDICATRNVFVESSFTKDCGKVNFPATSVPLVDGNIDQFLCLGLYDKISRICFLSSTSAVKSLPDNATTFDRGVKRYLPKDPKDGNAVMTLCNNWKRVPSVPKYRKTETFITQLDEALKTLAGCIKMCTNMEGPNMELKPLCAVLASIDELSKNNASAPDSSVLKSPEGSSKKVTQIVSKEKAAEQPKDKVSAETPGKTVEKSDKSAEAPNKSSSIVAAVNQSPSARKDLAPKAINSVPQPQKEAADQAVGPQPPMENDEKIKESNKAQIETSKNSSDKKAGKSSDLPKTGRIDSPLTSDDGASVTRDKSHEDTEQIPPLDNDRDIQNADDISERTEDNDQLTGGADPSNDANELDLPIMPAPSDDANDNRAETPDKLGYVPRLPGMSNDDDSHFFGYFTVIGVICIAGYVGYHNKQKIFAMVLEGRRSRGGRGRRRPSTANYRKLDCTLEEAVTSQCNSNVTHVIY